MILFDSGPLLAYVNEKDPHHKSAVKLLTEALKGKYGMLIVINYIIDEVLTLASIRIKSLGFGSGVITDASGKVYASGPATCMI